MTLKIMKVIYFKTNISRFIRMLLSILTSFSFVNSENNHNFNLCSHCSHNPLKTQVKLSPDSTIHEQDSFRNLFQCFYSYFKYNSTSSIQWYNQIFHNSKHASENLTILKLHYQDLGIYKITTVHISSRSCDKFPIIVPSRTP